MPSKLAFVLNRYVISIRSLADLKEKSHFGSEFKSQYSELVFNILICANY